MASSKMDKEKSFVEYGKYCSVCNKFCGSEIETHHNSQDNLTLNATGNCNQINVVVGSAATLYATQTNNSDENIKNLDCEIGSSIAREKENVKNQAVFPWFRDSLKYREAFPKLFVSPKLKHREVEYDFSELISSNNEHLAILGEAGAGKSTLLRFIFAFDKLNTRCMFFTAGEIKSNDENKEFFKKITAFNKDFSQNQLLNVLIDGVDEAYHNDFDGYKEFIGKLKAATNCIFWLGCRTDFYDKNLGENTIFVHKEFDLLPWNPNQSAYFIQEYSKIANCADLEKKISKLVKSESDLFKFKQNPFQLALLVFLAENNKDEQDDSSHIDSLYDLYEKFILHWLDREFKRGTSLDAEDIILSELQKISTVIYDGQKYKVNDTINRNTAISALLNFQQIGIDLYATTFYHRSLAAFFLARKTINAMLDSKHTDVLTEALSHLLKDDVTNFINAGISSKDKNIRLLIKKNLQSLYSTIKDTDGFWDLKQQIVYYITRLGNDIDVSDFLLKAVSPPPTHLFLRLGLAYGCVLSDLDEVRQFALEYAKSIASNSNDATTNKVWTTVYFEDINADPYTYKYDKKQSWKNARKVRIERFRKNSPRKKDLRFRLFDVPLFYSFLEDRDWDERDLSLDDFDVLNGLEFLKEQGFNEAEIEFLNEQKAQLITKYAKHLKKSIKPPKSDKT